MADFVHALARRSSAALLLVVVVAGCGAGAAPAAPGASGAPSTPRPSFSVSPITDGSASPSGPIETPEEAARLVIASDPKFAKVGKKDPDLIGQCCYYEAARGQEGYRVRITMGWGDCPAGCIDHHTWTYEVSEDGEITVIAQSGDPVPPGGIPNG